MNTRDRDWWLFISKINQGECIPFLGAGISSRFLPLAKDLADDMAKEYGYPMNDTYNLAKVSQFLAVLDGNETFPKKILCNRFKKVKSPDFTTYNDSPHAILAKLDFPVYITTNYDKFMEEALKINGKQPISDFCRWNEHLENFANTNKINSDLYKKNSGLKITPANPLVYHLHGIIDYPESILLTESDYTDFLTTLVRKQEDLLPLLIQKYFAVNPFLFIGYSLQDVNVHVIRNLLIQIKNTGYAVIPPLSSAKNPEFKSEKIQEYIERDYKERFNINILWVTAEEFIVRLSNNLVEEFPVEPSNNLLGNILEKHNIQQNEKIEIMDKNEQSKKIWYNSDGQAISNDL